MDLRKAGPWLAAAGLGLAYVMSRPKRASADSATIRRQLLGQRRQPPTSTSAQTERSRSGGRRSLPSEYGARVLPMLYDRSNNRLGATLERMVPQVFYEAPVSAFLGFTAIGRQTEDTADAPPERRAAFHELGFFQTPAGPVEGPAPNPDPHAANNAWGRLATSDLVRRLLGRGANMQPGAWKDLVADQCAVGLADLHAGMFSCFRALPEALWPERTSDQWAVALAFGSFSAGPGTMASHVRSHQQAIQAGYYDQPLSGFAKFVRAIIVQARKQGTATGPAMRHANPAYTALRTWQKLASGKALAERKGQSTAWFDLGFSEAEEQRAQWELLSLARGQTLARDSIPILGG